MRFKKKIKRQELLTEAEGGTQRGVHSERWKTDLRNKKMEIYSQGLDRWNLSEDFCLI